MLTFMKMGKINHATYVSNILIISCEDTVSFHKEPEQASTLLSLLWRVGLAN